MRKLFYGAFAVSLLLSCSAFAERVLVVGDSITGHSMNLSNGYTHQIRKALKDAGVNDVEFVPLGGSGQSVGSWQGMIRGSKTKNSKLDIKGIFVKDEFDKGADTVIVFLGMNDALAPYTDFQQLDKWKETYRKLIGALRERVKFKKLILASPTMLTETPYSYKNRLMDEMAEVIRKVASENKAEYLDIRENFKRFHENVRKQDPAKRFTRDFVHPDGLGHSVMTWCLLNGIGQKKAAEKYYNEKLDPVMKDFKKPGMSLYVLDGETPGVVTIKGNLRGGDLSRIAVQAPSGLKTDKIKTEKDGSFTITLKGKIPSLKNTVTVTAGPVKQTVKLNAPFLILTGLNSPRWLRPEHYKAERYETAVDADAKAGKDVTKTLLNGKKQQWTVYYPKADVVGGDDPNAVDFASVSNGGWFESGYLFRCIDSPDARKAVLSLCAPGFAGEIHTTVYLNGKIVYARLLTAQKGRRAAVPVELRKGRNTLIVRADHRTWQWGVSVGLTDAPDLKYSIE